jgi:hypothetical protein
MGNLAETLPTCNCTDPDCGLTHGATIEELDRYFTTDPCGWLMAHETELAVFELRPLREELAGDPDDLDALVDGAADVLPAFVLDTDNSDAEDAPEAWDLWARWSFSAAAFNAHHDASAADVRHTEFLVDEGVLCRGEVCTLPRG